MNSVLALKSYHEWHEGGRNGVWRFSGNSKPASSTKQFFRKNSELFMNSISRSLSGEKSRDSVSSESNSCDQDLSEMVSTLTFFRYSMCCT